jgi:hypothetical protein
VKGQQDIATLSHDNTRIREIVFSSNGKMLIAKSGDEVQVNAKGIVTSPSIHLWEMETKRKVMAIADREFGRASCISQDGAKIAFREKNAVNVMDLATKKVISTIKFEDSKFYRPINFCNNRQGLIIEQGVNCSVYDIQGETARLVRSYSAPGIAHYLSRDDNYAIETFGDSFRLQEFKTGNVLHDFALGERGKKEELRNLVLSPENRFVATLSDNKVRLWDMLSHKLAHSFSIQPKDNIFCFSADGRFLIGGSDSLKIWELKTKREIQTNIVGDGKMSTASVTPDGKYLACGDSKGNIKIWEFSDDNMAALYFAKEIENDKRQIPAKKEFEKTEEYSKKRQRLERLIFGKYLNQYTEKLSTENTIQEQWAEEDERREDDRKQQILNSREQITLTIDSIGVYDADKETFTIKISNAKERYSRVEVVKIPLRDNAQCFKQRASTLVVSGIKQLTDDLRTYEYYNVKIKSNCSGKEKDYSFGPQRTYLDE